MYPVQVFGMNQPTLLVLSAITPCILFVNNHSEHFNLSRRCGHESVWTPCRSLCIEEEQETDKPREKNTISSELNLTEQKHAA